MNCVSVPRQRTRSAGRPSVSAAICAKAVRWPWPSSVEPTRTTASPSDSRRTIALLTGCAPAASSPTERPRPWPSASGSSQPSAAAAFSTSPTRSASSGLPPRRTTSPRRSRFRRRISSGSRPARRATSSTWSSPAHWRCEAPNARYEPDGAVFVWTQAARTRTADQRYGPGAASPPVATTRGPLSA